MAGLKIERQQQKRREALKQAMALLEGPPPEAGLITSAELEARFFHDHADLLAGLTEAMERQGLAEAFSAMARHLEEDREAWLRRLALLQAHPGLRARRAELEADYLRILAAHFGRWGAAGTQGERIAEHEAGLALAALRGAERLWVRGGGRPILPVLVQEALAVAWPALYGHARRHPSR